MVEQKALSFEGLLRLRARQESVARELLEQATGRVEEIERRRHEAPREFSKEDLAEARAAMEFHRQKLLEAMHQRQITDVLQNRFANEAIG